MTPYTLDLLQPGECSILRELKNRGPMRRRLRELGFVEGTSVQCVGRSPGGDPKAYLVRGTVIALRRDDCKQVLMDAPGTKGSGVWG